MIRFATVVRPSQFVPVGILVALVACAGMPTAPDSSEQGPSLRPGQSFRSESGHHITLSGDYGLPAGTYAVVFTCYGEVDYRIDDSAGRRRNGKCKVTGLSNSVIEHGITGPGTLGIAIVPQTWGVNSFVNVQLSLP